MKDLLQYHPGHVKGISTEQLRDAFAVRHVLQPGKLQFEYTHYDRMIVGAVTPGDQKTFLANYDQLVSDFFLERREMGIINVGDTGEIVADGIGYELKKFDCLYLGRGTKEVSFRSILKDNLAQFFILSTPAFLSYPNTLMKNAAATPVELGSKQAADDRIIFKYIHLDGIRSCQLEMGLTILKGGSVWNTMPVHTHKRKVKSCFYFDMPGAHRVFHFMGQPQETRQLLRGSVDAVFSAPWSSNSGCGTTYYPVIWGTAGENQSFTNMEFVEIIELR